jgi:hypothetical protein
LNYDVHDKELLVIVDGLNKWSTYCKSTHHTITILSDHKNLEYWCTKKDLNLRQATWGEQLANYDFVITYQPGKLAGKPDILSRELGDLPWEGEAKHRQNQGRMLLAEDAFRISAAQEITLQIDLELLKEIKEKTEKDEELMDILKKLQNGE